MKTLIEATQSKNTFTDNGMTTNSSSLNKCLDLFFIAGASRRMNQHEIIQMFTGAYAENPDVALRILFWARDIRGGAGERRLFRIVMNHLTENYPMVSRAITELIPEYGRFDDLFFANKEQAIDIIKSALQAENNLCAKWMPRKGEWFNIMRKKLNLTPKEYRQLLVKLTNVVETKMCKKQFNKIQYSHVPSKAFAKYRNAFRRKDETRFSTFLESVEKGEEKINASAIFPNDIIKPYISHYSTSPDAAITQQWNSLPNYMENSTERIIPVCDVSGSMSGLPMEVSIALGLYISERNEGIFKDAFITFSASPTMQYLKGDIYERAKQLQRADWDMNTDLQKVFRLILDSAVRENITDDLMPTKILIISDMEFDEASNGSYWGTEVSEWNPTALEMIKQEYTDAEYTMPQIVFWNVNGRPGNVPTQASDKNTALVSGFSPSILTSLLGGEIESPEQTMLKTINNPRYDLVSSLYEKSKIGF